MICVPSLLFKSTEAQTENFKVYIYDSTESQTDPDFLGGIMIDNEGNARSTLLEEAPIQALQQERLARRKDIAVANRVWTINVVALPNSYTPSIVFVVFGGVMILAATAGLALWVYSNARRLTHLNRLKADAESDKAQLILENARQATRAERELNDFIAYVNRQYKLDQYVWHFFISIVCELC